MFTKAEIEKHIGNLLVLGAFLKEVPRRRFVESLGDWREPLEEGDKDQCGDPSCGSAFCIGGWVAVMPYFRNQGVRPDPDTGAPTLPGTRLCGYGFSYSGGVSHKLFGVYNMFDPTNETNEKNAALRRIDRALEEAFFHLEQIEARG